MSAEDFDVSLWEGLCEIIEVASDLDEHPKPVANYMASRMMEWQVGNGGFAKAAYNIPDWFSHAENGYRVMGLHEAVDLIKKAHRLLLAGAAKVFVARSIGALFQRFRESSLDDLNDWDELDRIGFWAEKERLAYVRKKRQSSRNIDRH